MTLVDVKGLKLDFKVETDTASQGGRGRKLQWREW